MTTRTHINIFFETPIVGGKLTVRASKNVLRDWHTTVLYLQSLEISPRLYAFLARMNRDRTKPVVSRLKKECFTSLIKPQRKERMEPHSSFIMGGPFNAK